jgi:hypothetical protein
VTTPRATLAADPDLMVGVLRQLIDRHERELADLRRELRACLEAAGRRPGDGSDQPSLFGAAAQPSLFEG